MNKMNIIPKNKTNLTFSPFSLFSLFVSFGENVKIVRSFFGNGIIIISLLLLTGCSFKENTIPTYTYSDSNPQTFETSSQYENINDYSPSNNYSTIQQKGTQKAYSVNGNVYRPKIVVPLGWSEKGIASWYGPNFHGKKTSNGEIYNMYAYTAAHKTLPMNTIVKVVNLNNGKSTIVRINDRGPFVKGRIIDLSYVAGKQIGLDKSGTAPVILTVIGFKGNNYVTGYMIQIGAFIKQRGAYITSEQYRKKGYNTKVLKKGDYYKVFIIGFNSYKEAKKYKLEHNINGFVVGN